MPRYTMYRKALEKLGLKQLDVYRYKDKDVIRTLRVQDGRIFVIELPKHREEMNIEEFVNYVKSKTTK
jgi:arginine deiminase